LRYLTLPYDSDPKKDKKGIVFLFDFYGRQVYISKKKCIAQEFNKK